MRVIVKTNNITNMINNILHEYITNHEDYSLAAYIDSLWNKTIRVGFNLERGDAFALISALGLNYFSIREGTTSLSHEQAKQ